MLFYMPITYHHQIDVGNLNLLAWDTPLNSVISTFFTRLKQIQFNMTKDIMTEDKPKLLIQSESLNDANILPIY